MKGVLEFNLPDEEEEFRLASNGVKLATEISKLRETLRLALKHGHQLKTPNEAFEAVRSELLYAFQLIDDQ